ncbi:MAG: acyltransferase family protein [Gemmatimonadales bacterium]
MQTPEGGGVAVAGEDRVRPSDAASPRASAAAAGASGGRLAALDAFRGLTIAGMLLVNNPGTWSAIYPPLRHAQWHGWTPTDLIFPFFVFIVGVTTHLALEARSGGPAGGALTRKILLRGGAIILAGLLLHAFPFFPLSRWETLRYPGVLQRIGLCFIAAALLSRGRSDRAVARIVALVLAGYWGLQALVAPPGVAAPTLDDPSATLSAWIDRQVFGTHLWSASRTWDPEGLLSTIPAVGTCLLGVLAGRRLSAPGALAERLMPLFAWGAIGMTAGLVWGWVFPINKNLWSSSYVLFTGGMASVMLATAIWLVDLRGARPVVAPLVTYGLNPLVAFIGSGMMARTLGLIRVPEDGGTVPLQRAIFESAFAGWLPLRLASLAYAIAFVLLWYLILRVLEARRLVVRF